MKVDHSGQYAIGCELSSWQSGACHTMPEKSCETASYGNEGGWNTGGYSSQRTLGSDGMAHLAPRSQVTFIPAYFTSVSLYEYFGIWVQLYATIHYVINMQISFIYLFIS